MPIFGICLFLIWFYFWIKGNIWASVIMAACPVSMMWMEFTGTPNPWDHPLDHLDTNPYNWFVMSVFFLGAFLPWYIHRRKARRMERALHGVRFAETVDEPAPSASYNSPPPAYRPPLTLGGKIALWIILGIFGIDATWGILKQTTGEDPTPLLGNAVLGLILFYIVYYAIKGIKKLF